MKKFIAMFLCVAMIASMSVVANAAIQLPDGGQIRPSGHSRAYGYTDGGPSGQAYMNCTIAFVGTTYGDLLASTASDIILANKAEIRLVSWQNDNQLRVNEGTAGPSVTGTYSLPLRGGSTATMGSAAHTYSSSEYGDWICGTEVYK